MLESFAVFICQMFYVFLLGFQSRNVRDGQMLYASITSTALGAAGLFMTSAIARSAQSGGNWWLAVAYIVAGPCGICLAMLFHDRINGKSKC
jgi:CHASE2 domain-containing sensor protein